MPVSGIVPGDSCDVQTNTTVALSVHHSDSRFDPFPRASRGSDAEEGTNALKTGVGRHKFVARPAEARPALEPIDTF